MDSKDINHNNALEIKDVIEETNEKTVINTTVLVETLNWSKGTHAHVRKIFDELRDNNDVIQLTAQDYIESLDINGWVNNSINYSDCTILQTMFSMGIRKIVSFDSDFKKINDLKVVSSIGGCLL